MIIFVYNADSGVLNAVFDFAHKIMSPSTYNCRLCQITYWLFSEKREWKEFRKGIEEEVLFLYRDEYEMQFEKAVEYPVILRMTGRDFEILLTPQEMEKVGEVAELIDRIRQLLSAKGAS